MTLLRAIQATIKKWCVTMNKNDILEAIHFGIRSANVEHSEWTGGNWVTVYGVESYIASCIARSIMDLENPPTYITLETKFSELYDNNGIRPRGPVRKASKDNNKLDLALYSDEAISYAIELKRFWSADKCLDDIERLCCLMRTLSRDKGGSLRGAIFALLVTVKPRNAEDTEVLASSFDKYEAIIADYLDKRWIDKGISRYSFSRGAVFDEPMVHEDGHLFSSLCVVVS